MWIPGPSSELLKQNVAGVGELSLAFFFLSCLFVIIESEWGLLSVEEHGLLNVGASLGAEHRLSSCGSLTCLLECGLLLDQGSNALFSALAADCHPLHHQGSPACVFKTTQKQGWHRMWWGGMFFVALITLNWSQQPSATNWDLSHPGRVRAP